MSKAHIPPAIAISDCNTFRGNLFGEKEKEIKGQISNMWLILCYTVQLFITKLCTNLIIPSQVIPEKSLTENVYMHNIGVRDGKKRKIEKEGKINISTLNFFYTIYLATL